MKPAALAVERWYEASEEAGTSTSARSQLRSVLGWTLSEEAEPAIGFKDDLPIVLAIDGLRLICARPRDPAAEGTDVVIATESVPLDLARQVGVVFSQQEHPGGWFIVRTWTIGEPGPSALAFDTRRPVSQFHDADYGGTDLIEKAVERLGWAMPGAA